jgi:hypothetical protein
MTLFLLLSTLLSFTAFADEQGGPEQTTSLRVVDQSGDVLIPDAPFYLYRVATVTEDGAIQIEPAFENSGVSLSEDDLEDSWSASAVTLENYVVARIADDDPIAPSASAQTNEMGVAEFEPLPDGLYLLVGSQVTIGQTVYTPLAMLIDLPTLGGYSLRDAANTVHVKTSSREREETPIELSVIKVWKDDGHEDQRPTEVTVTLYADEVAFDTVTLNADNNWRFTWTDLDDTGRWNLMESDIPEGYTVTSVQDGTTFVVTNTYQETPDTPTTPSQSKLPQTGQLWWPVSILAICGMAMVLVGVGLRKRGNDRHGSE